MPEWVDWAVMLMMVGAMVHSMRRGEWWWATAFLFLVGHDAIVLAGRVAQ